MKKVFWFATCLVFCLICALPAQAACWYDNTGHFSDSNYNYNYPPSDTTHTFVFGSMSSVATDCPLTVPISSWLKGRRMTMWLGEVSAVKSGNSVTGVSITDQTYGQGLLVTVQITQPPACRATSFKPRTMLPYAGKTGTVTGWTQGQTFCATGFVEKTEEPSVPMPAPGPAVAGFTCTFDPNGSAIGADPATDKFPVGQVVQTSARGHYRYEFTYAGTSVNCPGNLPSNFYVQPPVYLIRGQLTTIENRTSHATVYLLHDIYSDSDFGISKCAPNRFDPGSMASYANKAVVVTGVYVGGEFCATGFVPSS
jgi:hypothetical protein